MRGNPGLFALVVAGMIGSCLLVGGPALAGDGPGCSDGASEGGAHDARFIVRRIFDQADRDADGALSAHEYAEAGLERYGVSFEQSDRDGDGRTSFAEYLELYEAHHPPRAADGDTV